MNNRFKPQRQGPLCKKGGTPYLGRDSHERGRRARHLEQKEHRKRARQRDGGRLTAQILGYRAPAEDVLPPAIHPPWVVPHVVLLRRTYIQSLLLLGRNSDHQSRTGFSTTRSRGTDISPE